MLQVNKSLDRSGDILLDTPVYPSVVWQNRSWFKTFDILVRNK